MARAWRGVGATAACAVLVTATTDVVALRGAGIAGPRAAEPGRFLDLIAPAASLRPWHVEHDPSSTSSMSRTAEPSATIALRFGLGAGVARDQFAAMVLPVPPDFATYDRLLIEARATRPLRLSVQLRVLGNQHPPRWRRSLYLEETPRTSTIAFSDMRPVPPNTAAAVPLAVIGGLLLLLDTTHTVPGTSGDVVFSRLILERSSP